MTNLDLLEAIDRAATAATSRDREVRDFGPFRALLDPTNDLVYVNYAVLTAPFEEQALPPLLAHFRAHRRTPRFELTEELWPEAPAGLKQRGFKLELRQPMMLCRPNEFVAHAVTGIAVELLGRDSDIDTFLRVGNASFGLEALPSADQIDLTRAAIERGSMRCALARIDGEAAGVATTTPHAGVAELAGVGTLARFRRRGVALAASTALLADHFEEGTIAWLCAGDDDAEAVYRKLGFTRCGWRRSYIL